MHIDSKYRGPSPPVIVHCNQPNPFIIHLFQIPHLSLLINDLMSPFLILYVNFYTYQQGGKNTHKGFSVFAGRDKVVHTQSNQLGKLHASQIMAVLVDTRNILCRHVDTRPLRTVVPNQSPEDKEKVVHRSSNLSVSKVYPKRSSQTLDPPRVCPAPSLARRDLVGRSR